MSKPPTKDLLKFLRPFPTHIQERALWLRDLIWDAYPGTNELIYDNYNALAFGWSPTDKVGHTFCSIAVGRTSHNIHLGFYWGSEIADPRKLLLGNGNQYRYLLVNSTDDFPMKYAKKLMEDAFNNSMKKVKDPSQLMQGNTFTKSVSAVKRRVKSKKNPQGRKKEAISKKTGK